MTKNIHSKFIIITGGVLSGLGKGVVAASVAKLFSDHKKVVIMKCDGYLNVDPGTMNPIEHGEVFVQDDGGEVDLDFGHYERFLGINTKHCWNLTSGKIFQEVIEKERQGGYLGKTVQMIPHVTDHIKEKFYKIASEEQADLMIIEMGGTVGDIEMMLFNEAARQLRLDLENKQVSYIHLTYVPELGYAGGEQKTKPTQQSTEILRRIGIQPDIVIGRSENRLEEKTKEKIALFSNIRKKQVFSNPNLKTIYELPLIFQEEGFINVLEEYLDISSTSNLDQWKQLTHRILSPKHHKVIAICGKYTDLPDSYISVAEALKHAGAHLDVWIEIKFIDTTDIENNVLSLAEAGDGIDGIIIPGGFGSRGTQGKIQIIEYVRKNNIPFLGICLGFQLAVIEFARNVCNITSAHSTEIEEHTQEPVIDLLPEQINLQQMGGTMRLGGQDILIKEGTQAQNIFHCISTNGQSIIRKRFRHRYEVNKKYVHNLEQNGLVFSGSTPDHSIMQILELPNHPFFMGAQFHPELTSRLEEPDEMFYEFVKNI